ncbi:hypothetical protein OPV22_028698 [Ensete ventricosum]|uniref:RRM domain-containing protein n=1 Tax=Ensete ventricosum TaxID=4639 RepID=A0AAV8Q9B3_ENSVE|nr:hypothetical protein OPV22_028698 [Ensete ventricosum]
MSNDGGGGGGGDAPANMTIYINNLNEKIKLGARGTGLAEQYPLRPESSTRDDADDAADAFFASTLVSRKSGWWIAFVEYGDEMQSTVAMQGLQGFKITQQNSMLITYAKK